MISINILNRYYIEFLVKKYDHINNILLFNKKLK